jgi:hypothetical protein
LTRRGPATTHAVDFEAKGFGAVDNFSGSKLAVHELLASKTDFVIGDFTASGGVNWFGPEMVARSADTAVGLFDARQYRQLLLTFYCTLTGGSSPSVQWNIVSYDSAEPAPASVLGYTNAAVATGGMAILMGSDVYTTQTSGAEFGSPHTIVPIMPPFFRLKAYAANSPTGLTAPTRLFVYGIR